MDAWKRLLRNPEIFISWSYSFEKMMQGTA